ncbi:MAG: ABC transporter substrate-binding protein [Chitinivibrionia bacterium]|nr:ABC transporter substrate-binding protein [Chitinivibrionia bacterium]
MKKMFLILIYTAFFAFGQANDKAVKDAKKAFASKDYASVVQIYKSFADTAKTNNPVLEFLEPIYIEAVSFQKKYEQIPDLSVSYIAQFPNSSQVARVYYLWGVAKANLGEFVLAIVALDEGLSRVSAKEKETEKAIRNLITRIANDYISQEDKNKVIANGVSEETTNILRSNGAARRSVDAASDTKKSGGFSNKTIGLLVPMTGEFADLGKTTLNTVHMVLTQYEEKTGEKIALKVYDTEGSAIKTAQRVNELLKDNVSVVIGPVMSNTATVAAAVLSQYPNKAIMITPTATDDGIAALGRNIFQINLTQKALAEKIADYAVEDLNIKKFVILAPLDEYGRVMTEYFSAAVKEKGAVVEFTEYFSPSASDYRKQFKAIREYYTNLKFVENGDADMKRKADYLADSTITLGGLFLPVSQPQNAIQLAAQIPFHKLRAQILGSNGWGNQKVIDDGKTTVQNICFSSAHVIDSENELVGQFIESYRIKYGQLPNMVVAPLVADAVLLTLKALSQSASVADLSEKLLRVENYKGLSSEISFRNSVGVNSAAAVMKISGQRAIRVK